MKKLSFETVGSVAAIVVSIAALFIAWDEARIMRRQQHASFLPIVNVDASLSRGVDRLVLSVELVNDGVGPALVKQASLFVGGGEVSNFSEFQRRLLPEALRFDGVEDAAVSTDFGSSLGVLSVGEANRVMRIEWPANDRNSAAFEELKQRIFQASREELEFALCYCSVFGRCWRASSAANVEPERVKTCPLDGHDVTSLILQTSLMDSE
ncbi:MAG: hypothetical protein Tsb0010_11540 [Parvularculaceae bacterium]